MYISVSSMSAKAPFCLDLNTYQQSLMDIVHVVTNLARHQLQNGGTNTKENNDTIEMVISLDLCILPDMDGTTFLDLVWIQIRASCDA